MEIEKGKGLDITSFDPAKELAVTQDLMGTGRVVAPIPRVYDKKIESIGGEKVPTDYLGREFDAEIHMSDESGRPVVRHGNIRIKKGIRQKLKEAFTGNPENENPSFPKENGDFPKSDHENEKEIKENLKQAEWHSDFISDLEMHSEDAANTMWVVYSATLGPEALNQYEKLHPKLKKHFELFERRTGKNVDLPPGVSLAIGIATLGIEIVRAEPECKDRYKKAKEAVTSNLGSVFKNKTSPKTDIAAKEEQQDD